MSSMRDKAGQGRAPIDGIGPAGLAARTATITNRGYGLIFATIAIAGYVDAVGFTHLAGLYLSFMSGNSTQLGVLIGTAGWGSIAVCFAVIATFVAGATMGTLLADRIVSRKAAKILAAEAALVAAALVISLIGDSAYGLLPVVLAMGMQNVLHRTIGGADAGKTFVTGVLFSLGQSIAHALSGKGRLIESGLLLASWLCFVGGAAAGGLAMAQLPLVEALAIAFVLIGSAAIAALMTPS